MGSIPQISVLKGRTTAARKIRLQSLFESNAAKPNAHNQTALIYAGTNGETKKMSITELDLGANQLARAILDVTKNAMINSDGDRVVAVVLPPSDDLVVTLLALWKAGITYLPLDLCTPSQRLNHILTEARPILVITQNDDNSEAYRSTQSISFSKLQNRANQLSSNALSTNELPPSNRDPIAMILYTSGSTGIPKGVRIPHSAVYNRLQWQWREFPYGPEERVCVFKTALTFVDSVSELWGPLLHPEPRAVLIVPREVTKDPQRLVALLEQYKVERLVLVPTLLRAILMFVNLGTSKRLQNLKLWVTSGETLAVSLATQFVDYFDAGTHALCNFYGSTEIMGDVTYHVIRSPEDINYDGKVPIGVPVDNTILYLMDKEMRIVPLGETGELYASGRNLAMGYVNGRDPQRFLDNFNVTDPEYKYMYRTGDYAKIVKGTLVYEGRTDSQVKVRGHRVDLSEIEAAVHRVKGVQKAVVLAYRPGEIDQAVLAFVLPNESFDVSDKEVELCLQSSLPPYALPQVITIEKMPFLVNGKVDRQALLRSFEERSQKCNEDDLDIDYSGIPKDKLIAAECLFRTIAFVLGASARGRISSSANFYSLGGNSLNSVFTITKLRDQGFILSITDFISAKSLGEVIEKMEHESTIKNQTNKLKASRLKSEMLQPSHKADVYRIIVDSFYEKADLERWIVPPLVRSDYEELLDIVWDELVAANYSFVVKSETGDAIGATLNIDAADEDEPPPLSSKLSIVLNFLEYLEGPLREKKLPKGKGKVLHGFMMGTSSNLNAAENVEVIEFMERESLRITKEKGFIGMFTTNTNPLTQQLGTDVFNYTVLHNYQVNQYVAPDGTRPFKMAPDDQKAICCWKPIV